VWLSSMASNIADHGGRILCSSEGYFCYVVFYSMVSTTLFQVGKWSGKSIVGLTNHTLIIVGGQ